MVIGMTQIDPQPTTSYQRSTTTKGLSCTVY